MLSSVVWFVAIAICHSSLVMSKEPSFHGQLIQDVYSEYDLTIPLVDQEGVVFEDGSDGFPTYKVEKKANIKTTHQLYVQKPLMEFTIQCEIRPDATGGYIFAIVNAEETIVQFGIKLSPAVDGHMNVTMLYTSTKTNIETKELAVFRVPYRINKYIKMGFKVMYTNITFYHDCKEMETISIVREPRELSLDSGSIFYLAQAGPNLGGKLEVSNNANIKCLGITYRYYAMHSCVTNKATEFANNIQFLFK